MTNQDFIIHKFVFDNTNYQFKLHKQHFLSKNSCKILPNVL